MEFDRGDSFPLNLKGNGNIFSWVYQAIPFKTQPVQTSNCHPSKLTHFHAVF